MNDYRFTKDWFCWAPPLWEQVFAQMPERRRFLEIGSFEGRATVWLVENALEEGGEIVCVDTWEGGEEHINGEMDGAKERFEHNISILRGRYPNKAVTVYQQTSHSALADQARWMPVPSRHYDFIYIDGSHMARDVITDACMAFPLLKRGGVMVFDDYEWGNDLPATHRPEMAIDAFIRIFEEEIYLIHQGYQVAVQRK